MVDQIVGRDFKRFYADQVFWPEDGDTYHDDTLRKIDGKAMSDVDPEQISDAAVVKIESGWVDAIPVDVGAGKVDM